MSYGSGHDKEDLPSSLPSHVQMEKDSLVQDIHHCPTCGHHTDSSHPLWSDVPFGRTRSTSRIASPTPSHHSHKDVEGVPMDTGHAALPFLSPGSIPASVYMLTSISMGIGVFLLPGLLPLVGIIPGIALIVLFGVMSDFVMIRSLEAAENAGVTTFEDLMEVAFGTPGKMYLAASMVLGLFFGNCGHIKTATQLLKDIIEYFITGEYGNWAKAGYEPWYKNIAIYILLLSVVMPFCFQKTLGSLTHISTLTVSTVVLTSITMIFESIVRIAKGHGHAAVGTDDAMPWFALNSFEDFMRFIGVICIVYCSQFTLFPVYHEMHNRSPQRIQKAIHGATFVCVGTYATVSFFCGLAFGKNVQGNVLYNIPPDDYWVTFLCFMLVIMLTLLYPIINFPMITCLQNVFFSGTTGSRFSREIMSLCAMILLVLVVSLVKDLDDVFGLCGSLGIGAVGFLIPCLCYLKCSPDVSILHPKKILTIIILMISISITVGSSIITFVHIVKCVKGTAKCG